jgi:GTPase
MDNELDPNAETIIYDVAGDAIELDDSVEIPERWEDLTESEYTALLDQLGIPSDELMDEPDDLSNLPIVAVVGRPNVGKSTLVNRIIGRREAVVEDTPGVTRDRVRYESEWNGVPFIVVDTGGWEQDAVGMSAQVSAQAEAAINSSDVVIFVVDATVGATDADEQIVRVLRQAKVPVILVANKVDDERAELRQPDFGH